MVQIVQFDYEDLRTVVRNELIDAIHEIRSIPTPAEIEDRCDLKEACEITGCSESKMYKLSMDRKVPVKRFGRKLIFSRKALRDWMEANTVTKTPADEVMTDRLAKKARRA